MSKITIFLDLDGILVDFVNGSLKALNISNYTITPSVNNIEKWEGVNVTKSQFWKAIDATNEHFWADLEKYDHANDLVKLCESYGEVFILSSPSRNPYCSAGKKMWMDKHFPRLSNKMILTSHKYLCAAPNRILIDDTTAMTDKFTEYGGTAILLPQLWNKNYSLAGVDKVEYVKLFLDTYVKN